MQWLLWWWERYIPTSEERALMQWAGCRDEVLGPLQLSLFEKQFFWPSLDASPLRLVVMCHRGMQLNITSHLNKPPLLRQSAFRIQKLSFKTEISIKTIIISQKGFTEFRRVCNWAADDWQERVVEVIQAEAPPFKNTWSHIGKYQQKEGLKQAQTVSVDKGSGWRSTEIF